MDNTEKLRIIIGSARELKDYSWFSKIDVDKAVIRPKEGDRSIALFRFKQIYESRYRFASERGKIMPGFETLIRNLQITKAKGVIAHRMTDEFGFEYLIFTDPDIKELLGILRPKHPDLKKFERLEIEPLE